MLSSFVLVLLMSTGFGTQVVEHIDESNIHETPEIGFEFLVSQVGSSEDGDLNIAGLREVLNNLNEEVD